MTPHLPAQARNLAATRSIARARRATANGSKVQVLAPYAKHPASYDSGGVFIDREEGPGRDADSVYPFVAVSTGRSGVVSADVTLDSRVALLEQLGTDTSLTLPPGLPYDTWANLMRHLIRVRVGIDWWLGDAWLFGEHEYGEARAHAADLGFGDPKPLQTAAWVSSRFTPSRRREHVSFSHHREVAPLEPVDADALLDTVEAENLTREELRHRVRVFTKARRNGDTLSDLEHQAQAIRNGHFGYRDGRCIGCGSAMIDVPDEACSGLLLAVLIGGYDNPKLVEAAELLLHAIAHYPAADGLPLRQSDGSPGA